MFCDHLLLCELLGLPLIQFYISQLLTVRLSHEGGLSKVDLVNGPRRDGWMEWMDSGQMDRRVGGDG